MRYNKRDLKSYVRYDGSGRVIPGSNVLRRQQPKVGKWKETQAYECCNYVPPVLQRTFYGEISGSGEGIYFVGVLFVYSGVVNGKDAYERIQYDGSINDYYKYLCTYDLELETYVIVEEYYIGGELDSSTQIFSGDDQFVNSPLEVTSWTSLVEFFDSFTTFETTKSQFEKFDVTANWAEFPTPVTDEASFKQFLESGTDDSDNVNNFINVQIKNFYLVGDRLQCDLSLEGDSFYLNGLGITEIRSLGGFNNTLYYIGLSNNSMTTFDPIVPLSPRLKDLYLDGNAIITFDPTLSLPSELNVLGLYNNEIVEFNPTLPLPESLTLLLLYDNNMTTAGYTASEPWANAMSVIPDRGLVSFNGNVDSVSGTNLETILIAKGWTVDV